MPILISFFDEHSKIHKKLYWQFEDFCCIIKENSSGGKT